MKQLFSTWRKPEFLSTTNRGFNGGRTGVAAAVKQQYVTRGFCGSIAVVEPVVKQQCATRTSIGSTSVVEPMVKHWLKTLTLLLVMLLSVNVWGATVTYQHVFNTKPSTGNNISLSGVSWNITATNLNNYNSGNYAGVQIGASDKNGSLTLTSPSNWSYTKNAVTYTKITEVRLWLNTGGGTITPTVTIGGKTAASNGTVSKNSSAGSNWEKTSKVTFTPAVNGNTGIIVVSISTSSKAGYICCLQIDCEQAATVTRTVTWKVNNETYTVGNPTTQVNDGEAVSTLPTAPTTDCGGKTFVGWTAIANYTHATTAPGDLFSTAADAPTVSGDNVTYYAVFADANSGGVSSESLSFAYNSHADWTITTCKDNSSYYIINTNGSIVSPTFDVSNITQITANCRTYGGTSYNEIDVKCEGTTLGTITAASNSLANANISFANPKPSLSGTKSLTFSTTTATAANGPGVASIKITYSAPSISYSNYTTTCAAPTQCQTPVISLAEGTYTEAKTATITCSTDGATIHYTTDGTTPTASSPTYSTAITVNKDMTIKAIATKSGLENSEEVSASYVINYTVTFNMMGHGSAIAALTPVKYNASINSSKPTDPSVTGYTFGGWYKENTCTNAWNWTNDKVTDNITLYAKWTAKQCYLTFDKNDNDAGGSMSQQSFTFNETKALSLNTFTAPAHKHFTGWATTSDGAKVYTDGANYKMSTEGATLYAVWAYNQTTITLDKQNGSSSSNVTATYGSAMPSAGAVPTKPGYTFQGYSYTDQETSITTQYYTSTGASAHTWDIPAGATLTAQWSAVPYGITYTETTNLTWAQEGNPSEVNIETDKLTANYTVVDGYEVSAMTVTVGGNAVAASAIAYTQTQVVITTTFSGAVVITPTVTPKNYTLTFHKNDGATPEETTTQGFYHNQTQTLTANTFTRTGYLFTGWAHTSGAGSASVLDGAEFTYNYTTNRSLYAMWAENPAEWFDVTFIDQLQDKEVAPMEHILTGSEITFPTLDDTADTPPDDTGQCNIAHYHFVGWVLSTELENLETTATIHEGGSKASVTANATYYAIWATATME